MDKRIDVHTQESQLSGLNGLYERILRKFRGLAQIASMIPVYLLFSSLLGAALTPGVLLVHWMWVNFSDSFFLLQGFMTGLALAFSFLLYGGSMILLAPALNSLLRLRLKPWRGPYYSAETLKWFLHNGITYLLRFTFLEFVTPSPFSLYFYRAMGMKIGRGCTINTTWISDPSLIEMGDHVTIGGSVTLAAHYGQAGLLVFSPIKIGSNVTIGLKATVMGGVTIGDGAKILANSAVLPKTIIPEGETWGGVPAKMISPKKGSTSGSNAA